MKLLSKEHRVQTKELINIILCRKFFFPLRSQAPNMYTHNEMGECEFSYFYIEHKRG